MKAGSRAIMLLFALGLAWLLAGCGAPPGRATPTPALVPTTATAQPAVSPTAAVGGQRGLAGVVVAASDVTGQPDTPLADQLVLAVALAQADAILGLGGRAPTRELLRFLKADLPASDPAIVTTLSDSQGRYTLALAAGRYVLCLADATQPPPALPATTRGCGLVDVPTSGVGRADLSSGFGEVVVVMP